MARGVGPSTFLPIAFQGQSDQRQAFSVAAFISDVELAARLDVGFKGAVLEVIAVDPALAVEANRELLHAALANLLQNAFKFTHENTVASKPTTAPSPCAMFRAQAACSPSRCPDTPCRRPG